MLNLFDYLTELDRKRIENYIYTYGVSKNGYCGNAEYLRYWAKCKPHLFHLLGGELIYEFPISFEKPEEEIIKEIRKFILDDNFLDDFISCLREARDEEKLTSEDYGHLVSVIPVSVFIKDSIPITIKVKPNGFKKMLQLQAGMKPVRAIQKIIDYFEWDDLKPAFESFRTGHSRIFNDKTIKGIACLSIHPMDYMTMSDNDSDWSSCMSWTTLGCYHLGTVEMMNSNNVICGYIKSSEDYYFKDEHKEKEWTWNNKKWRQLFYVTKDIAVCGKAYPYQKTEISKIFLEKIKELTEKNLGRTYTFGPEPYRDMNHIGSNHRMLQNKLWVQRKDTTKHNIIFDSKGMYNDMFNDHDKLEDIYWCYRNKVKHNIVVSYSGKAPCICCGQDKVLEEGPEYLANYEGSYNERYENTGELACWDCKQEYSCDFCHGEDIRYDLIQVGDRKICKSCVKRYRKICPSCGEYFLIKDKDDREDPTFYARISEEPLYAQDFYGDEGNPKKIAPLHMCPSCQNKNRHNFELKNFTIDPNRYYYSWITQKSHWVSKDILDVASPQWSKYLKENLKDNN